MPLQPDEIADLSGEGLSLGLLLVEIFDPKGEKGRGISKKEGRKLLKKLLRFAPRLLKEVID